MLWIESAAAVFGLACVVLTVRQSIWCWPAGLVQVALYIIVFHHAKLYSDLLLHGIYVVMQIYGWRKWVRGDHGRPLPVTRLGSPRFALWVAAVLTGTAAWGTLMARATNAAAPYGDAFVLVASLAAQWLLTRKNLEAWLLWIAVDVVSIAVFYGRTLYPTVVLYACFLVLAAAGWLTWRSADEGGADAGKVRAAASWPSAAH